MSMIIPAGVNKIDWSPKDKVVKTVKTAGADEKSTQETTEEVDALAEAAKAFLNKKKAGVECEAGECKCEGAGTCEACGSVVAEDEIVEAPIGEEEAAEVVEVSDEAPVEEGPVDDVEEAEHTAIESIEVAIETAVEAVEEAKEAVEELKDAEAAEEGEEVVEDVAVEGIGDEEGEVTEVEIEVPGVMPEEDETEEVEVEKEGMIATMSTEKEPTVADSSEEFCKFAKLSPQNRSKIADYWVNMLGYPKDYVALLTKDYEK